MRKSGFFASQSLPLILGAISAIFCSSAHGVPLSLGDTLGSGESCGDRLGITFDKAIYTVAPGQPFVAQVLICHPPAAGLFSYGVEVSLEGGNFSGRALGSNVPTDLAFHTVLGAGADLSTTSATAVAKGSVDSFKQPFTTYLHTTLAYITVSGLPSGTYTLNVGPYNNLGPTEEIFVDGNGNVLDAALSYYSALVVVGSGLAPPPLVDTSAFGLRILPSLNGAAGRSIEFQGRAGWQYFVQYSGDLAIWTTVLPALQGIDGVIRWVDSGPPVTYPAPWEVDTRFYRLLSIAP